jgi:hypothetical protein
MTEHDPQRRRAQRIHEQLESGWIAHQRPDGALIIARVPRRERLQADRVRAERGPEVNLAADPRPANFRNVPPFGGGY